MSILMSIPSRTVMYSNNEVGSVGKRAETISALFYQNMLLLRQP